MVIFLICIVFIPLEQNANMNSIKKYFKNNFFNITMPPEETKILGFLKTTDHQPTKHQPTNPPTTFHF